MTLKGFLDYIVQEIRIAVAMAEVRTALNTLQLPLNHFGSNLGFMACFVQHSEPSDRKAYVGRFQL